ncbi:hypothetical protein B0H13DRAFT_1850797 [Mycena leptocephala]|nr:hypothetical protein B0H13DRAFT_1850797 [Mycena leptocephala]
MPLTLSPLLGGVVMRVVKQEGKIEGTIKVERDKTRDKGAGGGAMSYKEWLGSVQVPPSRKHRGVVNDGAKTGALSHQCRVVRASRGRSKKSVKTRGEERKDAEKQGILRPKPLDPEVKRSRSGALLRTLPFMNFWSIPPSAHPNGSPSLLVCLPFYEIGRRWAGWEGEAALKRGDDLHKCRRHSEGEREKNTRGEPRLDEVMARANARSGRPRKTRGLHRGTSAEVQDKSVEDAMRETQENTQKQLENKPPRADGEEQSRGDAESKERGPRE